MNGTNRKVVTAYLAALLVLASCSQAPDSPTRRASLPDSGRDAASPADAGVSRDSGTSDPDSGADAGQDDAPVWPAPPSGKLVGATVYDGGTEFRVWAPNATAVSVEGEFDQGSPRQLSAEPDGYWAARVDAAVHGQRYHFDIRRGDQTAHKLDPRARAVADDRFVDALIVDPRLYPWQTLPFATPPREQTVLYELHVPSFFSDADPGTGTFASVVEKLDYLQALGVNAIELLPTYDFGSRSGWGYNPRAWFATKRDFGGPEGLRQLVDEAHARGIAVLLDLVYNHYEGWPQGPLRCFDGDCMGQAGIYFQRDPAWAKTPWGPRPDFAAPAVSDFIVDSLHQWLVEYRVDGFRWDSVSNIRANDGKGIAPGGKALLRRSNEVTQRLAPRALRIAEDLKGEDAVTRALDAPNEQGFGFNAQWDGFGWDVTGQLIAGIDSARNLDALRNALTRRADGDPFQRLLFTENHDTVGNGSARLPQRIDGNDPESWTARKRSTLAAALMLTAPGIPMLFMGQEFLQDGSFVDPAHPLDWSRYESYQKVWTLYRDLIRLRRNLDGVSAGLTGPHIAVSQQNNTAKVLVYRRWNQAGDDVVVVVNLANQTHARYDVGLPADGVWHVRFNSDDVRYSADFGGASSQDVSALAMERDGLPYTGSLALGPYSAVILSR